MAQMGWIQELYAWACRRLYHELAGGYEVIAWLVSGGQWTRWRRLALPEVTGEQILELGFGTGVLLRELAADGRRVVGLDAAWPMQQEAARRLRLHAYPPSQVQGRGQALPFRTGHFHTIVATFPAPYILDDETLTECRRVLRPGGRLVILGLWVAADGTPMQRLPVFYGRPHGARRAALARRVADAGFTVRLGERRAGWAQVGLLVAQAEHRVGSMPPRLDGQSARTEGTGDLQ